MAAAQTATVPRAQSGPTSGIEMPIAGRPAPADHGKLSEHNIEWLQTQTPQAQMEFLLGAAVNHDMGANSIIVDCSDRGAANCSLRSAGRFSRTRLFIRMIFE
jgi:hypothetical protein